MKGNTFEAVKIDRELPSEDWMDTPRRNMLQAELIVLMCGENPSNQACEAWADAYSRIVHAIIDYKDNESVRHLVSGSRFKEAAIIIKPVLDVIDRNHRDIVALVQEGNMVEAAKRIKSLIDEQELRIAA